MKCSVLFEKTFGEGIIFRSVECEFCAFFHKIGVNYGDGKVVLSIFDVYFPVKIVHTNFCLILYFPGQSTPCQNKMINT